MHIILPHFVMKKSNKDYLMQKSKIADRLVNWARLVKSDAEIGL